MSKDFCVHKWKTLETEGPVSYYWCIKCGSLKRENFKGYGEIEVPWTMCPAKFEHEEKEKKEVKGVNEYMRYVSNRKKHCRRWFAWYPVTVEEFSDGSKLKVWLEYVEKNKKMLIDSDGYPYWINEYRLIDNEKEKKGEERNG